jgi:hypothetical protein
LDVSHRQQAYRGHRFKVIGLIAMLRRFCSRLFMEGRSGQKTPPPKATTDSFGVMAADQGLFAFRCLSARSSKPPNSFVNWLCRTNL